MIPTQHTVDTPYMVGPVHFYTLERKEELILFDTGPPTETGQRYLQEHVDLENLKHVIVTHCHIDHYGQSAWLEQQTDAMIYLPRRDIMKARFHDTRMAKLHGLFTGMGFTEEYVEKFHESLRRGGFPSFPEHCLTAENDIPDHLEIEVLDCPGHSQSDLVYSGNGWAITGDTLLRGIFQSPLLDVDLEAGGRFHNYEAYCTSLVKLAHLRGKLVLPGHRKNIESVDTTLLFYIKKTLHRVRHLRPYIGRCAVAEIIDRVFPNMADPFLIYLKASEILFMQDFLDHPELLGRALQEIGLFEAVAEDFFRVAELN